MKTLENQTLLYDEDCPLCSLYTTGFVKSGMLDQNGRKSYCELSDEEQNFVDLKRATNEIALVDNKTKTVIYGIDSLIKVVGFSFPLIEKVSTIKPIHFILKKIYSFVSYNRKVIIPENLKKENKLQCTPDFNYKYRFLFIGFALTITTFILFRYSNLIFNFPKSNITRELILAFGQIVFQGLFLFKFDKETIINYTGNLMTVSLMGSLILMPIVILIQFVQLPQMIIMGWFGTTVFIMFLEHFRRVKILKLPIYLSFTWILYRIIALYLLLNLQS
jgi:predicted DCC family thiol-disulfide oxidoreductase YuxK